MAIRQTLPPSHGLRVLMKPYVHGTGKVNWVAYQMLVLPDSVLHRADGFTNQARSYSFGHFGKHSDIVSTFPEILKAKDLAGISKLTKTLSLFTIAALTTIRSAPILSDWSGLLESWVDKKADLRRLSDSERDSRKRKVRQLHLEYKYNLIQNANKFLKELLRRDENERCPFLNPAVQATWIAV